MTKFKTILYTFLLFSYAVTAQDVTKAKVKNTNAFNKKHTKILIYSASNMNAPDSINTIDALVIDSHGHLNLGYKVSDFNSNGSFYESFIDKMPLAIKDFYLTNCLRKVQKSPLKFVDLRSKIKEISNFSQMKNLHKVFSDKDSVTLCFRMN
jgi:hypothetical protein